VVRDADVVTDIKLLIPDAAQRRRMSKVIKTAVSTAVECVQGVENIDSLDAIITATGWGCLTDSERFLRNVINDKEQLLNPTPFIQSTFNTIGGQIALLRHNHCYNVTYVNRSHSFEDALLDAMMRIADGESKNILLGAFDETTPSAHTILERMGVFRKYKDGEGAVFATLTEEKTQTSLAEIDSIDFLQSSLTEDECLAKYASLSESKLLYNNFAEYGLFPTSSAYCFAEAVRQIEDGAKEVIIYNEYFGSTPIVIRIKCIG
jgi:3-oxoacyl-(acyl-carrier-protein) synthase